jgi:plastocyanin
MRIGSFVIAVLLVATSALAHDSNSAFDGDKVTVLTGTVVEWKWTNPHVWIILSVDDGKGGKAQWAIEGRTPGQLVRAGWSKTTLKPGETITVDFSPAKDGSPTGLLTRVRRADGSVVGDPAPPPAQ